MKMLRKFKIYKKIILLKNRWLNHAMICNSTAVFQGKKARRTD
jgi:hypothetical protein